MRRDIAAAKAQRRRRRGARRADGRTDTVDRHAYQGTRSNWRGRCRSRFIAPSTSARTSTGALEDVIACGADRLLTAGGPSDAMKGLHTIASLQHQGGDRIRIMAGGGIRIGNVRKIALRTGVREVHTSLSTKVKSAAYDGGADGSELPRRIRALCGQGERRAGIQIRTASDCDWRSKRGRTYNNGVLTNPQRERFTLCLSRPTNAPKRFCAFC